MAARQDGDMALVFRRDSSRQKQGRHRNVASEDWPGCHRGMYGWLKSSSDMLWATGQSVSLT